MSDTPIYDEMHSPLPDDMEKDTVVIETAPCIVCGDTALVSMTDEQHRRYQNGENVGRVFPHWSADLRELLISGTHSACWIEAISDD